MNVYPKTLMLAAMAFQMACFSGASHATIFGEDDRFTLEQNDSNLLARAFRFTGIISTTHRELGVCPSRGSGFLSDGTIVTAKHVICGFVNLGCDLKRMTLQLGNQHIKIRPYGEDAIQCKRNKSGRGGSKFGHFNDGYVQNKTDNVRLHVLDNYYGTGLTTARVNSVRKILKFSKTNKISNCFALGVSEDTHVLQASPVHEMRFKRSLSKNWRIRHCGDKLKGASGGPIVCVGKKVVRVLGVISTQKPSTGGVGSSASAADQCNIDAEFTGFNEADYLPPIYFKLD